jgi:hypothetical protein
MTAEEKTFRVTFRVVGPITRSTLERNAPPPPDQEALQDLRTWLYGTRLQIQRVRRARNAEWLGPVATRPRRFLRTSFDEHMLLVAGGQLEKTARIVRRYFPRLKLDPATARSLHLLRNIYEHWETERQYFRSPAKQGSKSAPKFANEFPTGEPWSLELHPDGDVVLGKVVSLRSLSKQMRQLQRQVDLLSSDQK